MSADAAGLAAEYGLTEGQRTACEAYAALLLETQAHTNLIGPATIPELWLRHFADSAQLAGLLPPTGAVLDIGSGAGFPGLVLAILGREVTLVESRRKKAQFLEVVAARLALAPAPVVLAERVEALPPRPYGAITARAVAPLITLFDWSLPFAAKSTRLIFPKGRNAKAEIEHAERAFRFEHRLVPSRTAPDGLIVVAERLERIGG